jgi:phosphoribosylanthranilate isomerase
VTVQAKICGINSREALNAAVAGGAAYFGLVFYPPSPRCVSPAQAAALATAAPAQIKCVGLFVDASDQTLDEVLRQVRLDLLQFHGSETPGRVRAVKARLGLPVMKAVPVAGPGDLNRAADYFDVADRLLFDAKPPNSMTDALPGGNALAFDWELLSGRDWPLPWMLSGGLTPDNVGEAVAISGAPAVDVSSGVEDRPGHKDLDRIAAFLKAVSTRP